MHAHIVPLRAIAVDRKAKSSCMPLRVIPKPITIQQREHELVYERISAHDRKRPRPSCAATTRSSRISGDIIAVHNPAQDSTKWCAMASHARMPAIDSSTLNPQHHSSAFEYWIAPRTAERHSGAPRGIRKYEFEAHTRTASGRSPAAATFQQLILAAMTAESQGWYLVDVADQIWSGGAALDEACRQVSLDGRIIDEGAIPFDGWHASGEPIQHPDQIPTSLPSLAEQARNIVLPKKKWWRHFF